MRMHIPSSTTYLTQKIWGVSLKLLHCRDPVLPSLKAISMVSHFPPDACMRIIVFTTLALR